MGRLIIDKNKQKKIWIEAKDAAGPRYTCDINVELPIKEIFESVGRTEKIFEEINDLKKELRDTYKTLCYVDPSKYKDKTVKKNFTKIVNLGKIFLEAAESFGKDQSKNLDRKLIISATNKISRYFSPIESYIWEFERIEEDQHRQKSKEEEKKYLGHSQSEELKNLKDLERRLREFSRSIRQIDYFAKSHKAQLFNDPYLLILGEAGMGKTHLVCDITKERLDNGLPPTVIVLGEKLLNINNSLSSIFKATSIKGSNKKILSELNEAGKKSRRRSLIIIDAINEADRRGWKSGVSLMIKEVKKYPWVGLVMTCRVPFQFLYLPKNLKITTEYHQGFQDNELEAMTAFFNFYKLPLPQVPLLIAEFSSPLFLGCFCKTARDIKGGKTKVAKGIKDLALGQVGMTKILEDFYISKENWIIKKHASDFKRLIKKSWIWNKSGNDCLVKKIAKEMVVKERRYLLENEILVILKELSEGGCNLKTCGSVLKILVEEGVLIRDAAWDSESKKYYDVLKFSFHKFSDHIIARNLLYDKTLFDRNKVKSSLCAPTPLGNLFSTKQTILENIDLVEALMIEFPESIKKNKRLTEKDLIDYMPKEVRTNPQIRSAFIESLYWRKPENFLNCNGEVKKSIINYINKVLLRYDNSYREFLDLFVSTATKPFHPFNANRLSAYLEGFTFTGRDLFWSEYLRRQYGSGSIYKLISWIEDQDLKKIREDQASCVMTVLTWVLGTNVRLLRNRAARCLYIVAKTHPEKFFQLSEELLKIDDPYVRERLLAVGYGIAMALEDIDKKLISKALFPYTQKIYSFFFQERAKFATTNVLIRDYARGIIEVALNNKKDLFSDEQISRIRPLYKCGIRRWGCSPDRDQGKYRDGNSPLGWEFEKDTLRHLVGSRAYDNDDKKYIRLKENIMWRLYQMGYSLDRFGEIDKKIQENLRYDRHRDYVGKVERYGEKYSLIAYREMMGLKLDKQEIDKWWVNEDGRDGTLELDASFPESLEQNKIFSKKLTSGPSSMKEWMLQKDAPDISDYLEVESIDGHEGPWILIDGIIGEKNVRRSRKVTTFIYGVLFDDSDASKVEEFLESVSFPRNENIPSLPEVRSLFAGEVGWRENKDLDPRLYLKIKRGEIQKKLTKREKEFQSIRVSILGLGDEIKTEKRDPPEFKTETVYEKVFVHRLARWFSTKDYRYLGRDDDTTGLHILSKKIMKQFKLRFSSSTFNIVDSKGDVVAIPHSVGDLYGTHENLLYVRKDLIHKILKKNGKKFLLSTWGERQYWPENMDNIHRSKYSKIIQNYENIYKQIFPYPFKD